MTAEDRAKLFQTLANITRDIQSLENKIADKRKDEDRVYRMLGIQNPNMKRARISPEKVAMIRTHIVSSMKELHGKGIVWMGMQLLSNVTYQKTNGTTIDEIKSQVRAMAHDGEIEHNGMRGPSSSYRLSTGTDLVPQQ